MSIKKIRYVLSTFGARSVFLTRIAVLVREQKIGQWWCVRQALEDRVEEAGVAEVVESRSNRAGLRPGQLDFLLAEEDLGRHAESVLVLGHSVRTLAARVGDAGGC